jgi:hypothetical protein
MKLQALFENEQRRILLTLQQNIIDSLDDVTVKITRLSSIEAGALNAARHRINPVFFDANAAVLAISKPAVSSAYVMLWPSAQPDRMLCIRTGNGDVQWLAAIYKQDSVLEWVIACMQQRLS